MTIEWNKVTWYSKLLALILLVLTFYLGIRFGVIYKEIKTIQKNIITVVSAPETDAVLKDGEYCFSYNHEGTKDEPYTVNEFVDLTVHGSVITGTKKGTQNGPDMTNGYEGTLSGTYDKDLITAVFSYVIEGSANKEKELYKVRADQIGLEKMRYPLKEEDGMLIPDMTKEFKNLLYSRVQCGASN